MTLFITRIKGIFITFMLFMSCNILLSQPRLEVTLLNPVTVSVTQITWDIYVRNVSLGGENIAISTANLPQRTTTGLITPAVVSPLSIALEQDFSTLSFTPQMATASGQTVFRLNGGAPPPTPVTVPTNAVHLGTVTFNSNGAMTFPINIGSTTAAPNVNVSGTFGPTNTPITFSLANGNLLLPNAAVGGTTIQFNAPLPVKLAEFSAEKAGEKRARLFWISASEINSSHYEVERSYDAENFEKIGEVKAAGNSQNLLKYEFYDHKIEELRTQKIFYYRLKMVDLDGSFEYSDIRGLNFRWDGLNGVQMYPNPTFQLLNVEIANLDYEESGAELRVYDKEGRIVMNKNVIGTGIETLDMSNLTSGMYQVVIIQGKEIFRENIIKVH
jgi:hypothetical protein